MLAVQQTASRWCYLKRSFTTLYFRCQNRTDPSNWKELEDAIIDSVGGLNPPKIEDHPTKAKADSSCKTIQPPMTGIFYFENYMFSSMLWGNHSSQGRLADVLMVSPKRRKRGSFCPMTPARISPV